MKKNKFKKLISHTLTLPSSINFIKRSSGTDNIKSKFKKMIEPKKSAYFEKEQQTFDFWKSKLNYRPEILQTNYRANAILSYIYFLLMFVLVFTTFFEKTMSVIPGVVMIFFFFACYHRSIFRAKCIKDFCMYTNFFCVFKKADDIFPNVFEPIKEKFSLIYDNKIKGEKIFLKK